MNNFLIINFTLTQLIFFYFHIGFLKKKTINYLLNKYLLGFYYNLSIINLNYTIFFLKIFFNLLSMIILNNGKILLFSEYKRLLNKNNKFLFKFFNIYFYFMKWKPGFLFKLKEKYWKINNNNFIYIKSIPNLFIILSYQNYYSNLYIMKELKKLFIPVFTVVDTIFNVFDFFMYFTIMNTKMFKTIYFFFKLVEELVIKIYLYKKYIFLYKCFKFIIRNYKK